MPSDYLMNQVETKRLTFRPINFDDTDEWLPFFEDPASFQYWKGARETPVVECENWYAKQFKRMVENRGGMNALIEKATGKLIGHAGLLVQTVDRLAELEVAYSLLSKFRGTGFASEAARKCKEYAFDKELAPSLISIISLTNAPSANVAIKNGMRIEKQTLYNENEVNIFRIHRSEYIHNKTT
jgi:ribosomal-protein-alanine N-acetyltransferase